MMEGLEFRQARLRQVERLIHRMEANLAEIKDLYAQEQAMLKRAELEAQANSYTKEDTSIDRGTESDQNHRSL